MTTTLPIVHMTLYKHGVGYYRRRGTLDGEEVKLSFRREEMDDLLKSLTVIDLGDGQVRGVDYDTPQSLAERLAGCSVILDDARSMRDLLRALRGRAVELSVKDGSSIVGTLVGLDEGGEKPLEQSLVSVLQSDTEMVNVLTLGRIEGIALRDDTAAADLRFFLQTALGQETHRSITIRLSPGTHELEVSYIAPAPTWRVSYRLVMADPSDGAESEALLQGWGIFDNRLEEDLTDISLSLTAGMPISFVYDLYTPHTPERPVVEDESRVAAGPIMFDAASAEPEAELMAFSDAEAFGAAAPATRSMPRARPAASPKAAAASVSSAASGQAMGELFQYNVDVPVTVGRGQSAMVPIVSSMLKFKKNLIYNGAKMATHPVATVRFDNATHLTLERGPVTVIEAGEYVGEAVLPFTADQAEAVISYAVELGIHIDETTRHETRLQSLQIQGAYLLHNTYNIRRTTYRVDNRTAQQKKILIERPIDKAYEVFDTPESAETTLDMRRYQVEAQPRKLTEFVVQERFMQVRREELRKLSHRGLQKFFTDKFLDQQSYNSLKDLLDAWADISDKTESISDQERRRSEIYKMQEQARKNMTALSGDGEEGRLRGRYVKQLTDTERELAEIERKIGQLRSEIERKEQDIASMIKRLQ